MTATRRHLGLWVPPLMVMAVIFAFSQNPASSEHHGLLVFLGRKFGHLTGYALLMMSMWRATGATVGGRRSFVVALAVTVAYACTDEFHQTFIRGRVGTWHDVVIDTAGALIGAAIVAAWGRYSQPRSVASSTA